MPLGLQNALKTFQSYTHNILGHLETISLEFTVKPPQDGSVQALLNGQFKGVKNCENRLVSTTLRILKVFETDIDQRHNIKFLTLGRQDHPVHWSI